MKNRITLLLLSCLFISLSCRADVFNDVRDRIAGGDYKGAEYLLKEAVNENPGIQSNSIYLYLAGVVEFEKRNFGESKTLLEASKAKGNGMANLYLGKIAFINYDFDKVRGYYNEFKNYRKRLGQVSGEDVAEAEVQLEVAENALDRVEKIVVIDTITLLKSDFFNYYRLPKSAGTLINRDRLKGEAGGVHGEMAFVSESDDYMIWARPDSIGNKELVESVKLIDKGWEPAKPLSENLRIGRNSLYPFMKGDGQTLYFAADGPESMGGLDIFMARRDPLSDEFLNPLNIGMPFNSPFDDYMLAIDEENGIGWWASDRNKQDDLTTVYVFLVNDIRNNYDPDEENILSLAKLDDIELTRAGVSQDKINSIKNTIAGIRPKTIDSQEFYFPMKNGKIYTKLEDFNNPKAAQAMKIYIEREEEINSIEEKIKGLRQRYSVNKADNVKSELTRLETQKERLLDQLKEARNNVYKNEK